MIDPVWAGVVGTAVGGVVGSATSLLSPLILWKTEKKRLVLQHENEVALTGQKHEQELERLAEEAKQADLEHRRSLVSQWRDSVRETSDEWVRAREETETWPDLSPVGRTWFESLKPHLNREDAEIKSLVEFGHSWGPLTAGVLFDEIARIEHEWRLI
jgi:hypothetical protein